MTDDTAWSIAWPEGEEQCRISGEHQPYIAEGPTDGHPPERVACMHCDVTPLILISEPA